MDSILTLSKAGEYILILSAYSPNQIGDVDIKISSSREFEIEKVLPEGAGMHEFQFKGKWYRLGFILIPV